MEASTYIPMDRRQALARGRALPDRAEGTALVADISGFTPLTDALVRELGATYHSDVGSLRRLAPYILMECTGVPAVIRDCLGATAAAGIVCLTGVTEPGSKRSNTRSSRASTTER